MALNRTFSSRVIRWASELRPVRMITDPAFVLGGFKMAVPEKVPAGSLVIDAGAGQCEQRGAFRHARYVAVDLAVGDSRWDYGKLDIIADISALPVRSCTADAIICFQVLEHVPNPNAVVREFSRVLKPCGKVYLSVPQTWQRHQKPFDFYRYTSFGLQWLFDHNGFRVIELTPVGGYFVNLAVTLKGLPDTLRAPGYPGLLLLPFRILAIPITRIWFPIIAHFLDRLDHLHDYTVGYVVTAERLATRT